ncbi:MAG TPA: DUF4365 domain-containing protein, partial [Polyangium sp.]|nr:DUF4365 domain-containing protein [Polyangium sp.]
AQSPPVVLVVWDLDKQVGYWEAIPRIVEGLEKEKKKWREKASVTVKVPLANTTDEEGIPRLRITIARYHQPLFMGNKPLTLTMRFPSGEGGRELVQRFEEGLRRGQRVIFENGPMPELILPAWYQRLYGETEGETTQIVVEPQSWEKTAPPLSIEIRSLQGDRAIIPFVEMRAYGNGRQFERMSNEHQGIPLEFVINRDENENLSFTWTQLRFGRSVEEARQAASFVLFASMRDSVLFIRDVRTQDIIMKLILPPIEGYQESARRTLNLLEKLSSFERWIESAGKLNLSNGISERDARIIEQLYDIYSQGMIRLCRRVDGTALPDDELIPDRSKVVFQSIYEVELLGLGVNVGRVRETVDEGTTFLKQFNAAISEARRTQQRVSFHIDKLWVTVEFLDWPPPTIRLQNLATTQSGYFTLTQALESGFTSAEQLEIHERVERCADGVYRFLLHPPSEREDLVVTWLQTEQQGVFSHDTALALHELSDILPVRQHITVPPGWKPVEGMALSTNTVLHHRLVETNEKSWMGPVPYTKPLRTLVDCIEKGITSDLVIQAIQDARKRGLITQVEAERLRQANTKSA